MVAERAIGVGTVLDEVWRLDGVLRQTATGIVWAATDLRLGRDVAVKVLSSRGLDPEALARFERETRLLVKLDHPNVVGVHSAGHVDGVPYVVMRRVEGTPLTALFQTGGQPLPSVLRILRQLVSALEHLHAGAIVHRDLKPQNVLVGHGMHVTLVDLGLARPAESALTRTGVIHGTPGYLAPELLAGDTTADGRADVYSLGVILYELLTGKPPFAAATDEERVRAHLVQPRPKIRRLRPDLPEAADAVLARAMAVRPQDRYPSPLAVLQVFEALMLEPVTAPREPVTPPAPSIPEDATGPRSAYSEQLAPEDPTGPRSAYSEALAPQDRTGPRSAYSQALAPEDPTGPTPAQARPAFAAAPAGVDAADPSRPTPRSPRPGLLPIPFGRRDRRALVVWGSASALALAVLLIAAFWPDDRPAGPQPPEPIVLVTGRELGPTVSPPPVDPATRPEPEVVVTNETTERRVSIQTVAPPTRPARLRRTDPGVPPRRLVRRSRGVSRHSHEVRVMVTAKVGKRDVRAEVEIDEQWRGQTPLAVTLRPGDHLVRIDYRGYPVSQFSFAIVPGRNVQLEVELRSKEEAALQRNPAVKGARHHH